MVYSFNKFYRAGKNEETGSTGISTDKITEAYAKLEEQVAKECLCGWHDALYVKF